MGSDQIRQLYIAYALGFLSNNFIPPKIEDLEVWTKKLKREFRTMMLNLYEVDPLIHPDVNPDFWTEATEAAINYAT